MTNVAAEVAVMIVVVEAGHAVMIAVAEGHAAMTGVEVVDSVATRVVVGANTMMTVVRPVRKWSPPQVSICGSCRRRRVWIFSPSVSLIPGRHFLSLISRRFFCKAAIVFA